MFNFINGANQNRSSADSDSNLTIYSFWLFLAIPGLISGNLKKIQLMDSKQLL